MTQSSLSLSLRHAHTKHGERISKYSNILDSSEHLIKGQYMIKRPADVHGCWIRMCVLIKDTLWRCPGEHLWSSCGKGISRGWRESLACLNWRVRPERKTHTHTVFEQGESIRPDSTTHLPPIPNTPFLQERSYQIFLYSNTYTHKYCIHIKTGMIPSSPRLCPAFYET